MTYKSRLDAVGICQKKGFHLNMATLGVTRPKLWPVLFRQRVVQLRDKYVFIDDFQCVCVCVDANRKEACMYKFLFFQLYILKSQGTSGINYLPEVTQVTSNTGEKEHFTGRKNLFAVCL